MRGHDELVRLPAEGRNVLAEVGLPVHVGMTLGDATVLSPRARRDGERSSTVYHRDLHLLARACGRDDMFVRSEGPWRALQTSPGALTVVPAGSAVTFHVLESNEYSAVLLPDSRLQACADELGGRVELWDRIAVEDRATSQILELIDHELTQDGGASTLFVERSLDLLAMQLVRVHGHSQARPPRRGLAPSQVTRVTSYMRERLDQDISLTELAEVIGLSRFRFCTAFRLATGRTPHEWLTGQRIDRARQLLADPRLRITDIALAVGYATPSAFSASFRKLVGVTPSVYRRRST